MRICHIITRLIVGGAQENTILSCKGLADAGHEVSLIAGSETGPEGSLWEAASHSGASLFLLESLCRNPRPLLDWRCVRELTDILRGGRFDVVHTHSSKAGILGRQAARNARVPAVIHTIHGMSFNRTQSWLIRWLYRAFELRAARQTHAFVSVADAMTDQAVAAGLGPREKFTTVYSGMQTELYVPGESIRRAARARWGFPDDAIVVGTIARLFRNKGYEELLAAMPSVVARVPSLRFVWIGDGADRARYETELNRMGLRKRVCLTGLVPPKEISSLVGGFDLLVHASRWEGLPRALVQGLLMEVPGVTFNNDGAGEVIIDGRTGRLVPFGNTASLADAVVELAQSPDARRCLGRAGREHCNQLFSADRMVTGLERLYVRVGARA